MFEKRSDLNKLLVVAETGQILSAADKLAITQPALSRIVSKLEEQFRGRLFERIPTGVRLTELGSIVTELARGLLREIEDAEDIVFSMVSGRSGTYRVTAGPVWMQAILPSAVARFHETFPSVELKLQTTAYKEGIWLLTNGKTDMHCGGLDTNEPLPPYLAREHVLDTTLGIVAHRDHPLHARRPTYSDLADYPWIDFDAVLQGEGPVARSLLADLLKRLHRRTGRHVRTIIRTNSVGLFLMATGPYLSYLSSTLIENIPEFQLKPLPLKLGTHRYRAGIVSRRSTESLEPFRYLKQMIREVAQGRRFGPPGLAAGT